MLEKRKKGNNKKLEPVESTGSLERLSIMSEHTPVGVLLYDAQKCAFVEANQHAVNLLGQPEKDILALNIEKFQPDSISKELSPDVLIQSHLRQALEGASFYYECVYHKQTGGTLPLEVRLVRMPGSKNTVRLSFLDISDRKSALVALNILSESHISDLNDFLCTCVINLARVYGAQYAFIGLVLDENRERVGTQAVWAGNSIVDNFEYDLDGTPCEDILDRSKKLIPKDAAKLYPKDELLVEMGVESYFGSPLVDSKGKTVGLVSIMDIKPMELTSWTSSILGIYSQRIAFELEYHEVEQQARASASELNAILQNMQDTYYRTDKHGCIMRLTNSVTTLLGYKPDELIGKSIADLYVEPDGREVLLKQLESSGGKVTNYIAMLKHKSGAVVWVSTNAHWCLDDEGVVVGVEGTTRDITSIQKTEQQMKKLSMALEQSADAVMITDCSGIIEYVNHSFEETTGFTRDEAIGKKPNLVKSGKQKEEFYTNLWETVSKGDVFSDVLVNKRKNGSLYYEQKTIAPLKDKNGNITHFVSTGKDITERMHAQEKLQYLAQHDPLTELPNRSLFLDRLKHALARARWHKRLVAVMFLDLDRFKTINDSLGHDIGDRLLKLIANRLKDDIRDGDTVARLGGDEFAILLDDIANEADIDKLAKKVLCAIEPKFIIDDRDFYITASIGVSCFPRDGEDSKTLLKHADIAMYRAKDLGKNTYQFFSTEMSAKAFERLTLESSLRRALEYDEFILHYQPQIDVNSRKIIGVESLIRWQHQDLGMVSPLEFIPLLEETGQIIQVGEWVLRKACEQAVQWNQIYRDEPIRMSVNLSSRQFNDPDFVNKIKKIISDTGILPQMLELEITESVLMRNASSTTEAINTLSEMGVRFAIDDFGTGYSSLSYLRRFPIDTLKIDRSFIRDVTHDPDDAAITSAIIVMGQSLKMDVIAEGVETEEQLEFLSSRSCQSVQGYLFCKPLGADELDKWFEKYPQD